MGIREIISSRKRKEIKIKIKLVMNVWKICYIEMHGYNL
jgi:hypothetical protein